MTSSPDRTRLASEYARDDLSSFLRLAWPLLNPRTPLIWGWHIDAICEHLEAVSKGYIEHLLIGCPPGYTKTTSVTECWAPWEWLENPHYRYLFASHSQSLANIASDRRRLLLESDWYQEAFDPDWRLTKAGTNHVENSDRGWMRPVSVGARKVTGSHANRLITDDPIDARGAWTIELEKHVKWYHEAFKSRTRDGATEVVVMQRLANADLAGDLKDRPGWTHLCLPERCDESRRCVTRWQVPQEYGPPFEEVFTDPREHDEVLCPERKSSEKVTEEWVPLTPATIALQRQQDDRVVEGGIFPKSVWRWWHDSPVEVQRLPGVFLLPDRFDRIISAWDTTQDAGKSSDYTAGMMMGLLGAEAWVLEVIHGRMDTIQLEEAMLDAAERYPECLVWLVENANIGPATVRRLRDRIMGIKTISHRGQPKEQRASEISPLCHAGQVYWPHPSAVHWDVEAAVEECAVFPRGRNDDIVDTLTYCLRDHMEKGARVGGNRLPFEPDSTRRLSREEAVIAAVPSQLGQHLEASLIVRRADKEIRRAHRLSRRDQRRTERKQGPPASISWRSDQDG